MVCPRCGKNLDDSVSVCDQCGTPLAASISPEIVVPTDFHFTDDKADNSLEDTLPEGLAIINGEKLDNDKKKKKDFKLPMKTIKLIVAIVLVIIFIVLLIKTLNDYGVIHLF